MNDLPPSKAMEAQDRIHRATMAILDKTMEWAVSLAWEQAQQLAVIAATEAEVRLAQVESSAYRQARIRGELS